MDAISFKTPYDEGEDVYNGTENSELDDEDRERIGRIRWFKEALDDPKHYVKKTWVGSNLSRQLEEEETKILSHDLVC